MQPEPGEAQRGGRARQASQVSSCVSLVAGREGALTGGCEWLCTWSPRLQPHSSGERFRTEPTELMSKGLTALWGSAMLLCGLVTRRDTERGGSIRPISTRDTAWHVLSGTEGVPPDHWPTSALTWVWDTAGSRRGHPVVRAKDSQFCLKLSKEVMQ